MPLQKNNVFVKLPANEAHLLIITCESLSLSFCLMFGAEKSLDGDKDAKRMIVDTNDQSLLPDALFGSLFEMSRDRKSCVISSMGSSSSTRRAVGHFFDTFGV